MPSAAIDTQPAAIKLPAKIRGVTFPESVTRGPKDPAVSTQKIQLANDLITHIGKAFTIEATVKSWFGINLNQITREGFDRFIEVLRTFPKARKGE